MPQYNKYGEAMRNRVVKRFLQGEDWQVAARENGIPFSTVRSWVKKQKLEKHEKRQEKLLKQGHVEVHVV